MELKKDDLVWLLTPRDGVMASIWVALGLVVHSLFLVQQTAQDGTVLLVDAYDNELACLEVDQEEFLRKAKVGDRVHQGEFTHYELSSIKVSGLHLAYLKGRIIGETTISHLSWRNVRLSAALRPQEESVLEEPACDAFCVTCDRLAIAGQKYCFACLP